MRAYVNDVKLTHISIHAPARGATKALDALLEMETISIHAPARGATLFHATPFQQKRDFNPRSREGSDVSAFCLGRGQNGFQSTLPRGERHAVRNKNVRFVVFQSTLPRGERLSSCGCSGLLSCISIHAPARGATKAGVTGVIVRADFNPRSREGSDAAQEAVKIANDAFQSTLPRGERPDVAVPYNHIKISIHAPARGATFNDQTFRPFMSISIHAPARGATEKRCS